MPKKVIAIDCDDVLVDFFAHFVRYHNRVYGTVNRYEDNVTFDLAHTFGCAEAEMNRRVNSFYRSPEHTVMQAMLGASEAVAQLAQEYELHVVTSRPSRRRNETEMVIAFHFPQMFTNFHFTGAFAGDESDTKVSKSVVCHTIGAKLLVEDALHNAVEVASSGIPVIMPDRPWNQGQLPRSVTRSMSWPETKNIITRNIG